MPFTDDQQRVRAIEANRERFRRSNRGGDDLATRIVFAIITLGLVAFVARFIVVGLNHGRL